MQCKWHCQECHAQVARVTFPSCQGLQIGKTVINSETTPRTFHASQSANVIRSAALIMPPATDQVNLTSVTQPVSVTLRSLPYSIAISACSLVLRNIWPGIGRFIASVSLFLPVAGSCRPFPGLGPAPRLNRPEGTSAADGEVAARRARRPGDVPLETTPVAGCGCWCCSLAWCMGMVMEARCGGYCGDDRPYAPSDAAPESGDPAPGDGDPHASRVEGCTGGL